MTKIVKQYRVLYRSADGYATYMAVTSEGSELLSISPDGSRYNVVEGVDFNQAFWGMGDRHVTQIEDATVIDVELVDDPLPAIEQFAEPPAAPDMEPVQEPVEERRNPGYEPYREPRYKLPSPGMWTTETWER